MEITETLEHRQQSWKASRHAKVKLFLKREGEMERHLQGSFQLRLKLFRVSLLPSRPSYLVLIAVTQLDLKEEILEEK